MEKPVSPFKKFLAFSGSGMAAGAAIGAGGWSYAILRTIEPYGAFLGALAFSLGIILVCVCGLMLFTGKIGYLFWDWLFSRNGEKTDFGERLSALGLILLGNILGAYIIGVFAHYLGPRESIASIVAAKTDCDWGWSFVKACLCGVLVYAGVDLYRINKGVLGTFLVAICIAAFVLLGFDHCVANAFYWGGAVDTASWNYIAKSVLLCALGNSLGAIAVDTAKRGLSNIAL